jgi:hypothetical protein
MPHRAKYRLRRAPQRKQLQVSKTEIRNQQKRSSHKRLKMAPQKGAFFFVPPRAKRNEVLQGQGKAEATHVLKI